MLTGWRAIAVTGGDASAWLNDLVTADVEGLEAGRSRRSLLLTPTGRIRADLADLFDPVAQTGGVPGPRVVLAKPSTYMNVSGGPVAGLAQHHQPAGRRQFCNGLDQCRHAVGIVGVVDDDHDTLDYFTVALRAYGAVVAAASNALDALQLIHDGPLDIVLSDIAMPDHDGYWLVRELRNSPDPQLREVPVIATTAYGSEHPRGRALRAGFSEHLPKPVDPIVLRDTIARLAGRLS